MWGYIHQTLAVMLHRTTPTVCMTISTPRRSDCSNTPRGHNRWLKNKDRGFYCSSRINISIPTPIPILGMMFIVGYWTPMTNHQLFPSIVDSCWWSETTKKSTASENTKRYGSQHHILRTTLGRCRVATRPSSWRLPASSCCSSSENHHQHQSHHFDHHGCFLCLLVNLLLIDMGDSSQYFY